MSFSIISLANFKTAILIGNSANCEQFDFGAPKIELFSFYLRAKKISCPCLQGRHLFYKSLFNFCLLGCDILSRTKNKKIPTIAKPAFSKTGLILNIIYFFKTCFTISIISLLSFTESFISFAIFNKSSSVGRPLPSTVISCSGLFGVGVMS